MQASRQVGVGLGRLGDAALGTQEGGDVAYTEGQSLGLFRNGLVCGASGPFL